MALPSASEGSGGFVTSIFDLLKFGVSTGGEVLKAREQAKADEQAALLQQQTARIAADSLQRDRAIDLQLAQINAAAAVRTREVEAASGSGLDLTKNDLFLIGGGLLGLFLVMQLADGK